MPKSAFPFWSTTTTLPGRRDCLTDASRVYTSTETACARKKLLEVSGYKGTTRFTRLSSMIITISCSVTHVRARLLSTFVQGDESLAYKDPTTRNSRTARLEASRLPIHTRTYPCVLLLARVRATLQRINLATMEQGDGTASYTRRIFSVSVSKSTRSTLSCCCCRCG